MDIILKKDLPGRGFKNDIIKVKNGYARNFLIPNGFAEIANECGHPEWKLDQFNKE